jgi:hypothetical protein
MHQGVNFSGDALALEVFGEGSVSCLLTNRRLKSDRSPISVLPVLGPHGS